VITILSLCKDANFALQLKFPSVAFSNKQEKEKKEMSFFFLIQSATTFLRSTNLLQSEKIQLVRLKDNHKALQKETSFVAKKKKNFFFKE